MEERISEEDRKEVERLLYEIGNLQVRASVLVSKNAKEQDIKTIERQIQIDDEPRTLVGEANNIAVEFSDATQKLSKRLNNPAIAKTMNRLSQSNIYNQELVGAYLNQLIKSIKGVSAKTKAIIDTEAIKRQINQEREKREKEEVLKKEQKQNIQIVAIEKNEPIKTKESGIIEERELRISK